MGAEVLPTALEKYRNAQGAEKTKIWRKEKAAIIWQGRQQEKQAKRKRK